MTNAATAAERARSDDGVVQDLEDPLRPTSSTGRPDTERSGSVPDRPGPEPPTGRV
jgi:hypothetical protein